MIIVMAIQISVISVKKLKSLKTYTIHLFILIIAKYIYSMTHICMFKNNIKFFKPQNLSKNWQKLLGTLSIVSSMYKMPLFTEGITSDSEIAV